MNKYLIIFITLLLLTTAVLIILFPKEKATVDTVKGIQISTINSNPMPKYNEVRAPAVAGQFYPDNKDELISLMDDFLSKVDQPKLDSSPEILILPHAGYVFSGSSAAYGFKQIEGKKYDNVIIIGSSHNYPITELALYAGDAVETPLGIVPINKRIVNDLTIDNSSITEDSKIHEPEHSLEVEIPFLQHTLKNDFQIVLGLVNSNDLITLESMADSIKKILDDYPNTLVIISSDLSHYPNYDDALYSDKKVIESILAKDPNNLTTTINSIKAENRQGLDTCACGNSAIKLGMYLASKLNLDGTKLHYSNSGDTPEFGDKERVVGYAAIAFSKNSKYLTGEEQKIALKLARNNLEQKFDLTNSNFEDYKNHPIFSEKRGVFITLELDHQLRGCIGLIEPVEPLGDGIIEMAKAAAFSDHRFEPLTKEEFDKIHIEVSVLTPPEKISDPNKIILGKHGVIVRKGTNSGVYLPQVATDTGWSLDEFMNSLCSSKASLPEDCWKDSSTEIYTFEAQVFEE